MSTNPKVEPLLERIDPNRREAVRKLIAGAAIYTAPMVASFSMDSLEGVANAQVRNQTTVRDVPATSGWSVAALAAALSAAAAVLLRRRRDK
jgi:MYXO-CTERM domain-containing protein